MNEPKGFLSLKNRYILEGELISEAPLHIGGAVPSSETDGPFLRDSAGPYIPGSSVRGVMRSTLERILQSLNGNRGCVLFARGTHPSCLTDELNRKAFEETLKDKSDTEKEEALQTKVLGDGLCDICKLFGSPLMASKLRIADCRLQSPEDFTIRDGVGIDRDTEAAREKIKFNFEALEKCASFSFHLQLDNAQPQDFALLAILLSEMENGIDVGGKRSRGFGRVKLRLNDAIVFFDNVETWLTTGFQKMPVSSFRQLIQSHLVTYLQESNHAAPGSE